MVREFHTPLLTEFFVLATSIATSFVLYISYIFLAAFFFFARRISYAVAIACAVLLGWVSFALMKIIIQASRPLDPLTASSGFSFPSGHATIATIIFLLLAYFLKDMIKSASWRRLFICGMWFFVAIVAFSRLYLGVHFATDVVGGFLLGLSITCLFIHFFAHDGCGRIP